MEAASSQFSLKSIAPDNSLNIANTAAHDTALAGGFGAEKLQQPDVCRDQDAKFAHATDTQSKVLNERLIQTPIITQYKDPNRRGKAGVHAAISINIGGQSIDW